jgi:hypothetical protein
MQECAPNLCESVPPAVWREGTVRELPSRQKLARGSQPIRGTSEAQSRHFRARALSFFRDEVLRTRTIWLGLAFQNVAAIHRRCKSPQMLVNSFPGPAASLPSSGRLCSCLATPIRQIRGSKDMRDSVIRGSAQSRGDLRFRSRSVAAHARAAHGKACVISERPRKLPI